MSVRGTSGFWAVDQLIQSCGRWLLEYMDIDVLGTGSDTSVCSRKQYPHV
jgi:hypothetical protein